MDLRGEGEAERERGVEWGGDPRRRGAGDLIPSAGSARWCDGDAPMFLLFMVRSGEQGTGKEAKGDGGVGRPGWAGWLAGCWFAGPFGPGRGGFFFFFC